MPFVSLLRKKPRDAKVMIVLGFLQVKKLQGKLQVKLKKRSPPNDCFAEIHFS